MSTGVAVGLVALLVLGGGAVAYAVTRKPASDPLAPPDPSVADLPPGAAAGTRAAQAFGEIGLYEGPRVRAMRDRDPLRGDVRPPRALPDNPKTITTVGRTKVQAAGDLVTRAFARAGAGQTAPAAPPIRPPDPFGWA